MDGKFLKDGSTMDNSVSIIFSIEEAVGALAEGLKIFQVRKREVDTSRRCSTMLTRIISRVQFIK